MQATIEKQGNVIVVEPLCEILDASNSKEFKQEILAVIEDEKFVVVDLKNLRFVDSSGLGVMVSCLRSLHARDGDIKLCAMSTPVRALFELVRMHRIFDIYNTRDEAINAFHI